MLRSVFFLPILSANFPAIRGPKPAPKHKIPVTHDACAFVMGSANGLSDPGWSNFGITGDDHENDTPAENANRFTTIKYLIIYYFFECLTIKLFKFNLKKLKS